MAPSNKGAIGRQLNRGLGRLVQSRDLPALVQEDPVGLVHDYSAPEDQEVAGLIVAGLAYGRVASIRAKAGAVLQILGPHPAQAVADGAGAELLGFIYRFQKGDDLPRLVHAIAQVRDEYGSLAACFASRIEEEAVDYAPALDAFLVTLRQHMGAKLSYGQSYMVPRCGPGAAKRMWLYLRWMIRDAASEEDLGSWNRLVPGRFDPAKLVIPLDTHIARIGRYLKLTDRRSHDLETARQITAALRAVRPHDPLYYDHYLCHLGISGDCPPKQVRGLCQACPLKDACSKALR